VPSIALILFGMVVGFAFGAPVIGAAFLVAAVIGVRSPFDWFLGPKYGPKVVWGCTGATLSAMALISILLA
jgi:hypothetical protein